MLIPLLVAFGIALAAPRVIALVPRAGGSLLALSVTGLFAWFARYIPEVAAGAVVVESYPWLPGIGVRLAFRLDGLSLLLALLVTGFGALVTLYAGSYLGRHPHRGRFFLLLLAFMAAMLGVALADDIIALFVFWELTSVTSYLLIGFEHRQEEARSAALQALLVTGGGGLALLAGLLLLASIVGEPANLSAFAIAGGALRDDPRYLPALALVAIGAFTKSAQAPFHFWLPRAMSAPTPVSAYLHSATMVKAGIYLLARLAPALGGTAAWTVTLGVAGGATMVVGAVLALRHTDLKLVLAYSTVASLGTLTLLLGIGTAGSVTAAMLFLLVHALYKGALFLVVGAVAHEAGTRDLLRVGGLRSAMPVTAVAALLAGLSMAGVPPLFGYLAKEAAYEAAVAVEEAWILLPAVTLFANVLTVAAAGLVTLRPFCGATRRPEHVARDPAPALWLPALLLAIAGLALGMLPALPATLVAPAVAAVLGTPVPVVLQLWHGWTVALAMSVVTLAAGALVYRRADRIRAGLERHDRLLGRGPASWYDAGMAVLLRAAHRQTQVLTRGGMVGMLLTIVGVTALLLAATLPAALTREALRMGGPGARFHEWLIVVGVGVGTVIAVGSSSRMAAVLALGLSGFLIALLYVMLGAPDLAMTQFLVETLVVVVIVLVMPYLPKDVLVPRPGARLARLRDGAIAITFGAVMAGLLLAIRHAPFDLAASEFFLSHSVSAGHGRNVVNVILVDFRALDTLGEITVLLVAALGARLLLAARVRRPATPYGAHPSLILRTAARLLTPLLLLLSLFLLWRGHNEPGGGFVGGLVAAGALALGGIAVGAPVLRRILVVPPLTLAVAGLATAVASGLAALVTRDPFLTARWAEVPGELPAVGTPLLFDAGVYLLVVGFTTRLVLELEER